MTASMPTDGDNGLSIGGRSTRQTAKGCGSAWPDLPGCFEIVMDYWYNYSRLFDCLVHRGSRPVTNYSPPVRSDGLTGGFVSCLDVL